MTHNFFDARKLADLPDQLPLFSLPEVILLPRGYLPLNIFEGRYLQMVEDALANGRFIGIIQPLSEKQIHDQREEGQPPKRTNMKRPPLQGVGCLGRIIHFEEESDGRFQIVLKGEIRFRYQSDRLVKSGYRLARINFEPYLDDFKTSDSNIERETMLTIWQKYFDANDIKLDWDGLDNAEDERIVNTLSMLCPFQEIEKQALLEADSLEERAKLLTSLMQIEVLDNNLGNEYKIMQ